MTRQMLDAAVLRLDIERSLALLSEIFPAAPDPSVDEDYAEPKAPRTTEAYRREHDEIIDPMRRLFGMVREIATAVTHEVGAFG